jgi:hypothetical protein
MKLEEKVIRVILQRLPFKSRFKKMRVCRLWSKLLSDILKKQTHFGVMTSLEPVMSDTCCAISGGDLEGKAHAIDLTALLITDLREKTLLNRVLKVMDHLPSLTVIFISPQILLRLEKTQQDSFTQFVFDSYGSQVVCLQMPSFRLRSVEPLPQLTHLSIHSLQPKVIRVMEKTSPQLNCLEIMSEMRGESLIFLPRGIKKLKMRLRDESGSQFLSSGASQSVTDLHLITMSDINFGGKPRSLPRLKKLKIEANLNDTLTGNLGLFLENQKNLRHLTIGFLSRSRFSWIVSEEDSEDSGIKKLVGSLHDLEFLKMTSPSLDSTSAITIFSANPDLHYIEISGINWDDTVLISLSKLKKVKHLSLSVNGDSFSNEGMRTFIKGIRESSLEYLLLRDISDPSILTKDIKAKIQDMVDEGSLRKVLLCDHINWGFMII